MLSLIVLGALEERWSRKALMWFSAEETPLLLIVFCLSRNPWLSVLLLALFGSMQIIFRTVSRLVIQVETPRELLGPGDERVPDEPRHALAWLNGHGRLCRRPSARLLVWR